MRDFNKKGKFREGSFGRRDSDRKFGRSDRRGEKLEMHKVICDKCGKSCEVPFKPSSDKPIFCDDCFREERNRNDSRRPDSRNSRRQNHKEREYFKAVCDECGQSCEVPFKPTSGKPVLCSMCFDKQGGSRENKISNNSAQFDRQFKVLNDKLDEILKSLSQTPTKDKKPKEKSVTKTKVKKDIVKTKKLKSKTSKRK